VWRYCHGGGVRSQGVRSIDFFLIKKGKSGRAGGSVRQGVGFVWKWMWLGNRALWIVDWGYRRLVAQKQSTLLTSISAHDNWHAHLRAINMQPMLTHLELSWAATPVILQPQPPRGLGFSYLITENLTSINNISPTYLHNLFACFDSRVCRHFRSKKVAGF